MPATRLATELTTLLGQIREQGGTVSDAEAAIVLRAIEAGAREVRKADAGSETAYLALIARLLAKKADARYASAREVLDALALLPEGDPLTAKLISWYVAEERDSQARLRATGVCG